MLTVLFAAHFPHNIGHCIACAASQGLFNAENTSTESLPSGAKHHAKSQQQQHFEDRHDKLS